MSPSIKKLVKKIPGTDRIAHAMGLVSNPLEDRAFLLEMLPKNSVGAEIGVHKGEFSEKILEVVHPKQLHLIDPWKHESSAVYQCALYGGHAKNGQDEMDRRCADVCARFQAQLSGEQVKIHRGFSTDVLGRFADDFFDWVYIDGNHLYDYVKKDIDLSFRKTKIGGLVTGDDYMEGGWWEGGVKKAVDEFAKTPAAQLVEIRNNQFVFRRKS
jgi:hypothetical protein